MRQDAMILLFWMLNFKPTFSLSSFTFIKMLYSSSLSVISVVSSAYLRLSIFLPAILIPWTSLVAQIASIYNVGDPGLITGLGRSLVKGNDNPLQYSCLKIQWMEEPVRLEVAKSRTGLSNFTCTFHHDSSLCFIQSFSWCTLHIS